MPYFGSIFFDMGGGSGQNYFHSTPPSCAFSLAYGYIEIEGNPGGRRILRHRLTGVSPSACNSTHDPDRALAHRDGVLWELAFGNVTGVHWTGSPNKSIDQIGKKCPKNVRKLCFRPLWTIFGHVQTFFDIFRTFCRHSHFLGCPTICPLQALEMLDL